MKAKKAILTLAFPVAGRRILAAVSGGADSTALALGLRAAGADLAIAHAHHGMRGEEADGDAEAVRRLAERLGVPFFCGKLRVPERRRAGESPEMAARRLRKAFLAATASREGYGWVATGHTADDQAETLLMRLARGTSPAGLAGMRVLSADPRHPGLSWVRPLLRTTHREAVAYLEACGETWREDSTNRDETIPRNRVRRRLLPALREWLNPRVVEALGRLAELEAAENDLVETLAGALEMPMGEGRNETLARLAGHPALRRRAALARQWAEIGAGESPPTYRSVSDALAAEEASKARPPRESGVWRIGANCLEGNDAVRLRFGDLPPDGREVAVWADATGNAVWASRASGYAKETATLDLAAAALDGNRVLLRRPRAGDRMEPLHLGGTKKLSDIFTDLKIPREARSEAVVAESGGRIAGLGGYRISAGFQVRPGEEALRLRFGAAEA